MNSLDDKKRFLHYIAEEFRVLYVDDDRIVRSLVGELLDGVFAVLDFAENAREGLQKYDTGNYDLVLSDLIMPGMMGHEMIDVMCQRNSEPAFVVVSSSDNPAILMKLIDLHVKRFIPKPVEPAMVYDALISACEEINEKKELRRYRQRMEELVSEQTRELTELNSMLEEKIVERTQSLMDQTQYTRSILDLQTDIVFVMEGSRVVDANKSFFRFFDDFDSYEQIQELHNGIISLFELAVDDNYVSILPSADWFSEIAKGPKGIHKIRVKKEEKYHFFSVNADEMSTGSLSEQKQVQHIVTLSDITEMELMKENKARNLMLLSVGQLAAGITHEINTPLTYAKGNLEMMKMEIEEVEDSKLRQELHINTMEIDDAIRRISNIVESMREIAGKGKEEAEEVKICTTIIMALRMVHNRIKHISPVVINGHYFSLDMQPDQMCDLKVFGNKQRIEQVWIVVLNNALDELFKSEKCFDERLIKIDVSRKDEYIVVRVKDNAGGIPEYIMPTIFEPFASNKPSSGMGLGLNIARQIVEEHHGEIFAYNEDGGAVFEISMKAYEEEESDV